MADFSTAAAVTDTRFPDIKFVSVRVGKRDLLLDSKVLEKTLAVCVKPGTELML